MGQGAFCAKLAVALVSLAWRPRGTRLPVSAMAHLLKVFTRRRLGRGFGRVQKGTGLAGLAHALPKEFAGDVGGAFECCGISHGALVAGRGRLLLSTRLTFAVGRAAGTLEAAHCAHVARAAADAVVYGDGGGLTVAVGAIVSVAAVFARVAGRRDARAVGSVLRGELGAEAAHGRGLVVGLRMVGVL